MTLAKIFVTGKITKAPEKRFTQNNLPITSFAVDINPQEETIVRAYIVGTQAEKVANEVALGDNVLIEGRLQTQNIKLSNGKERKVFEINASTVEKISGTASANDANQKTQSANGDIVQFAEEEISNDLIDEDEIPF